MRQSRDRLAGCHDSTGKAVSFSDCLVVEIARKAGHLPVGTLDRALSRTPGALKL
jgi:hypothetical protein